MKIERNTRSTAKGSASWFTGDVYVNHIAMDGSGPGAAIVHFTPGARTAWHRHELGQTIHILDGVGRVQKEGGPVETVYPRDIVFFEPNENHWHRAAPNRFMVHMAFLRVPESGEGTDWGDHVTPAEYSGASS